jgi:3D (Asp-Asp-Asp) domain-containing protein
MVVYGGFRYLLGSAFDDIARGKEIIQDAIAGLILIFAAYLILQTINPATLNLNVLGLTTITFTEGEHGGEEALEPAIVSAAGGTDEFRKQSCDGFATSGEEFQASFTHYFKPPYGDSSNYSSPKTVDCGGGVKPPQTCLANPGSEVSGNPPDIDAPWSFFCAVAMECSCPRGLDTTKRCYSGGKYSPSGERQGWYPCSPFGRSVPYCDGLAGDGSGQQEAAKYSPNKTVAADKDCFSVRAGCQILVDGSTTLTITDSGSGIRGRRFDLYTTKGGSPSVSSGSHKVKVINPDVCKPAGSYRGGAP